MKDTRYIDALATKIRGVFSQARFNHKYTSLEKKVMEDASASLGWDHDEVFLKASEVYIRPDASISIEDRIPLFVGGSAFDVTETDSHTVQRQIDLSREFGFYAGHLNRNGYPLAIITGGTPPNSLPFQFQQAAKQISPDIPTIGVRGEKKIKDNSSFAFQEYRDTFDILLHYDFSSLPMIGHNGRFYMPLLYRNPINVSLADNSSKGGIAISLMGGSGTLNEMALAYHQRLILGFYKELDGASKKVKDVCDCIFDSGQRPERMVYFEDHDHQRLIHRAIAEYSAKQMNGTPLSRFSVYDSPEGSCHVILRDAGRHVTRKHTHFNHISTAVLCGIDGDMLAQMVSPALYRSGYHKREPLRQYHEEGHVFTSDKRNGSFECALIALNKLTQEHPVLYQERNPEEFSAYKIPNALKN